MVTDDPAALGPTVLGPGLTTAEAAQRLEQFGPNVAPEEPPHPLRDFLKKFWAPVPWMLEATIALEFALGRYTGGGIIAVLLVFNAILSFVQEKRAQNALALLRERLAIQTRVMRDGRWLLLPAEQLVPGDLIHVRMGDLLPADIRIGSGSLLVDQSALTGESVPVEAGIGHAAYAGTIVKRGEATGEVTTTGIRTRFGKTAELVRLAKTGSHLATIIFTIVKYLVAMDALLVVAVLAYSFVGGIPLVQILPFALILLVASVPVALPATFTLATALGALDLAKQGVLTTRLSAIEEAAGMDVLCSDKTGTITCNELAVSEVQTYASYTRSEVLQFAAMASREATQDPIDLALINGARAEGVTWPPRSDRLRFIPFDSASKRSEAWYRQKDQAIRAVKGAPQVVGSLSVSAPTTLDQDVERLASSGARVLAVAAGSDERLQLAGLVALEDPPREDSSRLIQALRALGIRVLMITGDSLATALAVARRVGIGNRVCPEEALYQDTAAHVRDCDVFAGVLPEDKFRLVQSLQQAGHTVGMTGDGVNDAPALKQAEVGIAVANATDVAKAAASLVLTSPGLSNIVAAVETSRRIYQRMLTYTLNKIIKTFVVGLLLSVGLFVTGVFVTTPTLIVLLLFANDFVTMSIATDRVVPAPRPNHWRIGPLVAASLVLSFFLLGLAFGVVFWGRDVLALPLPQLQTLVFVFLVASGQGTVFLVRERRHLWSSWPSRWLIISAVADILVVSLMATQGLLMAAIPATVVLQTLGGIVLYLLVLDYVKIGIMAYFRLE